jgi:HD-GYP domain-containing protein (c-di-GMP phosphodiesterase class II)
MKALLRERRLSVLAMLGAVAAGPAAIVHFFGGQKVYIEETVHFFGIGFSAGFAALAAVALTREGRRRGDGRAVLVGTAFSAMAALLLVHGLTTPEVLTGDNGVVAFSGAATLPVGGAVLALSAVPPAGGGPRSVRPLLRLQALLLILIGALGAVGILAPDLVPTVPKPSSPVAIAALAAGLVFFLALGIRAARTFLLTRRRADFAVVLGVALLGVALVPALTMDWYHLGFWIGHFFELAGVALVATPVALDLHRGAQSRPLAGDLRGSDLVSAADSFLGPTVKSLLVRLAEKDAYTEGHTRRVALLTTEIGEDLGLAPARLRDLALGAMVHDVGKLSVPDEILQKPAKLTDEEFAIIRRHPVWGRELVDELAVFSPQVASLVLDHHERLDGKGYPRGLSGKEIDLDTRILTVCDVYDALISTRVYREAWSPERALRLLWSEVGEAFDPVCVGALERVLERQGTVVLAATA